MNVWRVALRFVKFRKGWSLRSCLPENFYLIVKNINIIYVTRDIITKIFKL